MAIAVCTRVGDVDLLERVLQRQRVHDGGEHAHVVGAVALDVGRLPAAPDVAAAHDDRGLDAEVDDLGQLARDQPGGVGVDAGLGGAGSERLAGELQQDPLVAWAGRTASPVICAPPACTLRLGRRAPFPGSSLERPRRA